MASVNPEFGVPLAGVRKECAPVGRVCAEPDCDTVLSRYNKAEVCSLHAVVGHVPQWQKREPVQPAAPRTIG